MKLAVNNRIGYIYRDINDKYVTVNIRPILASSRYYTILKLTSNPTYTITVDDVAYGSSIDVVHYGDYRATAPNLNTAGRDDSPRQRQIRVTEYDADGHIVKSETDGELGTVYHSPRHNSVPYTVVIPFPNQISKGSSFKIELNPNGVYVDPTYYVNNDGGEYQNKSLLINYYNSVDDIRRDSSNTYNNITD